MKKVLIALLFIPLGIYSQAHFKDCRNSYWEPVPVENYVGGVMILSAFPLVEHVNNVLYAKYVTHQVIPNYDKWANQRAIFAVSYMATSVLTVVVIRKIRLRNKK